MDDGVAFLANNQLFGVDFILNLEVLLDHLELGMCDLSLIDELR